MPFEASCEPLFPESALAGLLGSDSGFKILVEILVHGLLDARF